MPMLAMRPKNFRSGRAIWMTASYEPLGGARSFCRWTIVMRFIPRSGRRGLGLFVVETADAAQCCDVTHDLLSPAFDRTFRFKHSERRVHFTPDGANEKRKFALRNRQRKRDALSFARRVLLAHGGEEETGEA